MKPTARLGINRCLRLSAEVEASRTLKKVTMVQFIQLSAGQLPERQRNLYRLTLE